MQQKIQKTIQAKKSPVIYTSLFYTAPVENNSDTWMD